MLYKKGDLYRINSWLSYIFSSRTRYSIHSPFVYEFVENVIYGTLPPETTADIRRIRMSMLRNRNLVEITDFGTGSGRKHYEHRFEYVSDMAKYSTIGRKYGRLLYRIVAHLKPAHILEMGTSLGISTLALAKAAPDSHIITLEGCSTKAGIAARNFEKLHCTNIEQQIGQFDILLPSLLAENPVPDLVFIDGNHTGTATLRYFEMLMKHSHEGMTIIFDDIHWSKDMAQAWEKICSDERVTVSIDLYQMGIVFMRKELTKQHFVIRY